MLISRSLLMLCLLICLLPELHAQRYTAPVFASSRTISGEVYNQSNALAGICLSESWTDWESYKLDVYEPLGDTASRRPVIIWAHGGAFVVGDRQMSPVEGLCYDWAEYGYVVVSIDYRKCFNPLSTNSSIRAVYRAIQDMRAAVRWVKGNADMLRIDTGMVFAGGNSAGAIMALHAAVGDEWERPPETYLSPDLGCADCTGNFYTESGRPAAVINCWGAIFDTAMIEPTKPPVISFHGSSDNTVDVALGPPFGWPVFPDLYGSRLIHNRLDNIGISNSYFEFPGQDHEPWDGTLGNYHYLLIRQEAADFLYNEFLIPNPPALSGDLTACEMTPTSYDVELPVTGAHYEWAVSGGTLLSTASDGSSADIEWGPAGSGLISVRQLSPAGVYSSWTDLTVNISVNCCTAPFALSETILSPTSVTVSWDVSTPNAMVFDLQGSRTGSGVFRGILSVDEFRTVDNLLPGESYTWKVRTICLGDGSDFSEERIFTMPAAKSDVRSHGELQAFPNPVSGDQLHLRLAGEEQEVSLLDARGHVVWSSMVRGSAVIPTASLSPGLYALRSKGNISKVIIP